MPQCSKELKELLLEVFEESCKANWDGYGALPVTEETYQEAVQLIDLLPRSIPLPEIAAEPAGEIGFEWYKDKNKVFVISVKGDKVITYAGLFWKDKIHGTEPLKSNLVTINSLLKAIYKMLENN